MLAPHHQILVWGLVMVWEFRTRYPIIPKVKNVHLWITFISRFPQTKRKRPRMIAHKGPDIVRGTMFCKGKIWKPQKALASMVTLSSSMRTSSMTT